MGLGDSPWWEIFAYTYFIPIHLHRLIWHSPYEKNFALSGSLQGAALLIYFLAAAFGLKKFQGFWIKFIVIFCYPIVVFATNEFLS